MPDRLLGSLMSLCDLGDLSVSLASVGSAEAVLPSQLTSEQTH